MRRCPCSDKHLRKERGKGTIIFTREKKCSLTRISYSADIRVLQDSSNFVVVIEDGKKLKLDDQGSEESTLTFQEAVEGIGSRLVF